jgi:hypothetical protein
MGFVSQLSSVLLLVLCSLPAARGSIMDFHVTFDTLKMEILSEGPMYSTNESPFQAPGKKSTVTVDVDWMPLRAGDLHTIAVVFTENASMTHSGGLPLPVIECKTNAVTSQYESHYFTDPGTIAATYEVKRTTVGKNFPRALIFVCPCVQPTAENGLTAKDPKRCWSHGNKKGVLFKGQVSFSNAFGYLSAEQFAFLPFYALMTAMYFTLLTGFIGLCFWFRKNLTPLHAATALLAAVGTLECALYFILYVWKNTTGTSTWPPTPLQWVAAIVGVAKRSLGRVLLIAVALGYSVVKPKLSKITILLIALLTVVFSALSVWKEVARDVILVKDPDAPKAIMTTTEAAIQVVDIIMLLWCLAALVRTQMSLKKQHQAAKLKMYNALIAVMLCFIVIWGLFEAYRIAVTKKFVSLDWQLAWILNSFWHVAGFAILVTIAIVWRPSPTSQDLSYWVQLENLSFDDDGDNVDVVDLAEESLDEDLDGFEKVGATEEAV